MRCCKINTTAYNPRRVVKAGGGDAAWPFHPQSLQKPEQYEELQRTIVDLEKKYDPGVPVDSYVVCYIDPLGVWKTWLPYDGIEIPTGTFHVIFESRDGGNYQMFNTAFQKLRKLYRGFLFTCDDILVYGDQYYKKIIDRWEDGCGYIALQGGGEPATETEPQHHVQGSIGFTTVDILEEVCAKNNGELPHSKKEPWTQEANIAEGEIPFTNKILELGYHFVNYNDSREWKEENLCLPFYNYVHKKNP